ncbi:translation initiation factor IF-2 [Peptococcaceae bacterium]|nr:translation initiation factor IF-2 [Peptococcaceae bacterium]
MMKKRVYELAKDLNMKSKDVIQKLSDIGITVKSALSSVTEQEAEKLVEFIKKEKKQNSSDVALKTKVPKRPPDRRVVEFKSVQQKSESVKGKKSDRKKNLNDKDMKEDVKEDKNKKYKSVKKGKKNRAVQKLMEDVKDIKDDKKKAGKPSAKKDKKHKKSKSDKQLPAQPAEKKPIVKKPIVIEETITVQKLAEKLRVTAADVIKSLMELGVMATINQEIDSDTAILVADKFGYEVHVKEEEDIEEIIMAEPEDDPKDLKPRPPVVAIMGHVDHGKTSLLDAIRKTNVTEKEAGGITQHIGAYQVEVDGKKITFLDTPGHAAFTSMRARGAQVTDIAVLVVAADDGVMPQTVEAINHIKAAGVHMIIAVNKIDKPDANPNKVYQDLANLGLVVEKWGGDIVSVEVSAKKRIGLDELLEMILLVAEIAELKANPDRPARAVVIEAKLDKGRGPVTTVLVKNGTLKQGDIVIAGCAYGRVRAMIDHKGRRIKEAPPSTPVEILGLNDVPNASDILVVVEDEKTAKAVVEKRLEKKRKLELNANKKISLDDLFEQIQEGKVKELPIIVKADVQGSVEALTQALVGLSNDEVKINVVHGGVGAITETDIMLASASNAIVLGFNVRPNVNAKKAAKTEKVDLRLYRVIYEAIDDIKKAMSGLLEPEYQEVVIGRVEVRKTFKASKIGTIAGSYVVDGKVTRDAKVRVIRDGIVIHEGEIDTLKRFKDDVKEVVQGYECGITIKNFNDIKEGDEMEIYAEEAVKREIK